VALRITRINCRHLREMPVDYLPIGQRSSASLLHKLGDVGANFLTTMAALKERGVGREVLHIAIQIARIQRVGIARDQVQNIQPIFRAQPMSRHNASSLATGDIRVAHLPTCPAPNCPSHDADIGFILPAGDDADW